MASCTGLGKRVVPRLRELVARGSKEAGFTQPRDHYLAQPCILNGRMSLSFSILNLNGSAGLHSELVVGGEGLHVLPHLHRHPGTDEIG